MKQIYESLQVKYKIKYSQERFIYLFRNITVFKFHMEQLLRTDIVKCDHLEVDGAGVCVCVHFWPADISCS